MDVDLALAMLIRNAIITAEKLALWTGDIALRVGLIRTNQDRCWWCLERGRDTREHRFKRKLLVMQYGEGEYDPSPLRIVSGEPSKVRSPNSQTLKYDKSMCQVCNNERSKQMDGAFDQFFKTALAAMVQGVPPEYLELDKVFPEDTSNQIDLLLRAFGKELACRIRQSGHDVPFRLRRLVSSGWNDSPCLKVLMFRAKPISKQLLAKSPCYGGCGPDFQFYSENYIVAGLVVLLSFGDHVAMRSARGLSPSDRLIRLGTLHDHPLPILFSEPGPPNVIDPNAEFETQ